MPSFLVFLTEASQLLSYAQSITNWVLKDPLTHTSMCHQHSGSYQSKETLSPGCFMTTAKYPLAHCGILALKRRNLWTFLGKLQALFEPTTCLCSLLSHVYPGVPCNSTCRAWHCYLQALVQARCLSAPPEKSTSTTGTI